MPKSIALLRTRLGATDASRRDDRRRAERAGALWCLQSQLRQLEHGMAKLQAERRQAEAAGEERRILDLSACERRIVLRRQHLAMRIAELKARP